ncbi:MAG: hypothetical protein ACXVLQ_09490 [Bacteriovorax sp.]
MSLNIRAEEFVSAPPSSFQLRTNNVAEKLESTLIYADNFLKRYSPEGADFSEKVVSNNTISFVASKTVLFITTNINIRGQLDSKLEDLGCAKQEKGYKLIFRFDGSDSIVSDNVDRIEFKICTQLSSANLLNVIVRTKIFKGNDYSVVAGPITTDLIKAQISPLIRALSDEVLKMH